MPYRVVPIVTGEIYHIFNRGVEKRDVFLTDGDYQRFFSTLIYYKNPNVPTRFSFQSRKLFSKGEGGHKNLIEIIAFCLMPNHFHLLVKQLSDKGIATYIGKLANSYTRYFNTKHNRVGHLFQGPYKAVRVESDEQLTHVSRYIHLNPFVGEVTTNLKAYRWSSYLEYIGLSQTVISDKSEILNYFPNPKEKNYEKFVLDQADYAKTIEFLKYQLIDEK